jgi:CRP-like cAMP-binding protein
MSSLFVAAAVSITLALGVAASRCSAEEETSVSELSEALAKATLFSALTDGERANLKSAAALRRCGEGERIIEQGKLTGRMFIILDGGADVLVNGQVVASLPPQSLVGEIEFLDSGPASADVVVSKKSRLIELNNAALSGLLEEQPRLGYLLMREIARIESRRLRAMDEKLNRAAEGK